MLKNETWPISVLVKAFSKCLENKGLCTKEKIFMNYPAASDTNFYQDLMIFTLIAVKHFLYPFQNRHQ
jgi:hypothetical protein